MDETFIGIAWLIIAPIKIYLWSNWSSFGTWACLGDKSFIYVTILIITELNVYFKVFCVLGFWTDRRSLI